MTSVSSYSIRWQGDRQTLVMVLGGFWPKEQAIRFKAELASAVNQARGKPFNLVADLSELPAQPAAVVALQAEAIALLVGGGMRRIVVVGACALLRMQVKRASPEVAPIFVATMPEGLTAARTGVAKAA